jgi:N-acetylornithine carbamoyltransferase
MQTDLRGRDMITTQEFTDDEIWTILDVAFDLKRKRAVGEPHAYLRDKVLAMLFFFSSTRTRISFEAGMAQLGGHAQFIDSKTTQVKHGDTTKELGAIIGRYTDGIAIRQVDWGVGNQFIREIADASRVPVLNMQCEIYHPFQILADAMTIVENFGRNLKGRTINVSWAYASSYSKPMSVPHSLILLMTRFGMNVRLTHPPEYKLMPDIVDQATDNAKKSGGSLEFLDDFDAGFKGADIVLPKSWGPMLTTLDPEEDKKITNKYQDWIADERRMAMAQDHAIYMHPLPADRDVEVASAVLDGPQSRAWDQAENRLHAQKAVMALTMR